MGDVAKSYNELGPRARVDLCCRAHDHCPMRLKGYGIEYGVHNFGIYTK